MENEDAGVFPFGRRDDMEAALACAGALFIVFRCEGEDDSLRGDIICLAGAEAFDVVREISPVEGALLCFSGEDNLSLAANVLCGGVEDRDRGEEPW